jgi:hypothetical protein
MATAYTTNKLGVQLHTGDIDYVAAFNTTQSRIDTLLGKWIINVKGFADQAGTYREAGGVGGDGDDAIIQLAVARATANGETLFFPAGTYKIATAVVVSGFDVLCDPHAIFIPAAANTNMIKMLVKSSWTGGIINVSGFANYSGNIFTVTGSGSYWPLLSAASRAPLIQNVYAYGAWEEANRGCGLYLYSDGDQESPTEKHAIGYCTFRNLRFYRLYRGIYCNLGDTGAASGYINGNIFSDIHLGANVYSIELYAAPGNSQGVSGNIFKGINIQPTTGNIHTVNCLKITNSHSNQFKSSIFWDLYSCVDQIGINVVSGNTNYIDVSVEGMYHISDNGTGTFIRGLSLENTRGATMGTSQHYDWAPNGYVTGVTPAPLTAKTKYVSDAIAWGDCVLGDFLLVGSPRLQAAAPQYLGMAQAHVTAAGYFKIVCTNQLAAATITPDSDDWYIMRIPNRRRTMQYSHVPGSIAAGAQVVASITVPGAAVEDFIIATPDKEISDFMWSITISASEANTAYLVLHNFGSGAVNPGTILWSLKLIKSEKANIVCGSMRTPALTAGSSYMNQFTLALTSDVRVGDFVLFSPASDISGLMVFPQITSTNGLKVGCFNGTAGNLTALPPDPAFATWRACWIKADDGFMFL